MVVCALPVLLLLCTGLEAELIKVSALKKEKAEFILERDIFSPFKRNVTRGPRVNVPMQPPLETREKPKVIPQVVEDVSAEVNALVAFEGYVMKNARRLALLTINGEFYVVGKDDVVLEKYKIINVDKKTVTLEVDSEKVEITLKGDDENENQ